MTEKKTEFKFFPYDTPRRVQENLMSDIAQAIQNKSNLIVHAPTGLGKTVASIVPALEYAIEHKKKILFLTSRHTQHTIAIETLKEIKEKFSLDFSAVDFIGKKSMCSVPGIEQLYTSEFYDYCKKQRSSGSCEYFNNTRKDLKLTTEAQLILEELNGISPLHIENFTELCGTNNLCAYEMSAALAKEATAIVSDYYYAYNPHIRNSFLNRIQTSMNDCIIIVDEAHNLPDRIRNLMTSQISSYTIKKAINEAKEVNKKLIPHLVNIQDFMNKVSEGFRDGDEKLVSKDSLINSVGRDKYDEIIDQFEIASQNVKETEKKSSLASIANFLEQWKGPDKQYTRIVSQKRNMRESVIGISYKCLDPSIVAKESIENSHSTILMSGTLTPTELYKDILGFSSDNTVERTFPSPFPETNRLSLIVPKTTTKFSARSPEQFSKIADICAQITNTVPGNSAVFFPSYYLRNQVYSYFTSQSNKTAFVEESEMSKEEKSEFLEKFKQYKNSGAVLLGVMSGSFGEGVDLPGDLLKCVIVVGLPLQQPNMETKELIKYYDNKFNKGWDYGYVSPAFSKCLQSAGRCIRSETDRGAIIFLDERYAWQNYQKNFPSEMNIQISAEYIKKIDAFFNGN